jgi:hypothetical protein
MCALETTRQINATILQNYLPKHEMQKGLALLGKQAAQDTFMNEREILYKVLFDMKHDMNEMRQQLNGLLASSSTQPHRNTEMMVPQHTIYDTTPIATLPIEEIQETEHEIEDISQPIDAEVEELPAEPKITSMDDMKREGIRLALLRNGGNRKTAAAELNISERTLYRKIKEYGL